MSNWFNNLLGKDPLVGTKDNIEEERKSLPLESSLQASEYVDTHVTYRKTVPSARHCLSKNIDSAQSSVYSMLVPIRSLSIQNNCNSVSPDLEEEQRLSRQKALKPSYSLSTATLKDTSMKGGIAVGNCDNLDSRSLLQIPRKRGRHISGMFSQTSMDLNSSNQLGVSGSLVRMRNCSLGHSDPQISASAQYSVRLRKKDTGHLSYSSVGNLGCRRSLNASTSPILSQRCRSPNRLVPSSTVPAKANAVMVPLRTSSSRIAPSLVTSGQDCRRWSVASLPSSSGYGTPGSNSAFSSEYSSQEQLCDILADLRFSSAEGSNEDCPGQNRPRSRSLTGSIKYGCDSTCSVMVGGALYKERFPKAKKLMEERLIQLIEENASLSGITTLDTTLRPESESLEVTLNGSPNTSVGSVISRRSILFENLENDPRIRLIADGATRFLHYQILEIANDCLSKSRDDLINAAYFAEISQRLEAVLAEAHEKTSHESLIFLSKIVKNLLMVISQPARILECLEFDPDQFYHFLHETEGVVREQLGAGNARVPDLPQYILSKLGFNKNLTEDSAVNLLKEKQKLWSIGDGVPVATRGKSERRPPSEDDYETVRLISNGAYGAVYLVRHKETRQRFALKRMKKQTLLMLNQINQVYAERDILTFTDNPFVVSFYGSFETRHHLCMLMEYVEGGDCAALLKKAGTLPLDTAQLYIAETVLAIDYLHSYGIVHRDLKPDNLLITAMGHIKLTDFGLSKIGLMNRATLLCENYLSVSDTQQFTDKQLCGTPEYIAPEVILRQGYGKPVDWWALGIILYEFLIGTVPFMADTPEHLFSKIVSEEAEFPEGEEALSVDSESLIRRLLEKDPLERLGTVGGAQQLMADSFFAGLDFKSLLRQKAEFVPQLEGEEDTSYFDSRTDRYNHDVDSGEEENAPMFGSFDTASPRHSVVSVEPLQMVNVESIKRGLSHSNIVYQPPNEDIREKKADCPSPTVDSVVLFRKRFSSQRQNNLSSSSSGTNGTGCLNTACSSTDSSLDAKNLFSEHAKPVENFFKSKSTTSALPRFSVTYESDHATSNYNGKKELTSANESRSAIGLLVSSVNRNEEIIVDHDRTLQLEIPKQYSPFLVQQSPGSSVSSASSFDGVSSNALVSIAPVTEQSCQIRPATIVKKGPKGFGFTIRSVRVYLGEHSDYYTIEHLVTKVEEGSPAFQAGLRPNDLITHVYSQPVSNLTHPQLMHRLLSYGSELSLKVTPLSSTSIREGAPRHTVGKLVKKKPKKLQRRVQLERKTRKSSLLRRLSGKRANNDIIPGSSSQKQTFMPRSISSQDNMQLNNVLGAPLSTLSVAPTMDINDTVSKRRSDAGLSVRDEDKMISGIPLALSCASRPSTLQGLRHKVAGVAQHLTTRKQVSAPIAVSPLARDEIASISRSPSPSSRKTSFTRIQKKST